MTPEKQEILKRTYSPQYEQFLEEMLQEELKNLPSVSLDKVQIFQGRALVLQGLLAELRRAAGVTANRTAKPNFSTP